MISTGFPTTIHLFSQLSKLARISGTCVRRAIDCNLVFRVRERAGVGELLLPERSMIAFLEAFADPLARLLARVGPERIGPRRKTMCQDAFV